MHYIYELVDPRTGIPNYIGITGDPSYRIQQHLGGYDGNPTKKAWIRSLKDEGIEVQMNIIETVDDEKEAKQRERYWMQEYLNRGVILYNFQGVSRGVVPLARVPSFISSPVNLTGKRTDKYIGDYPIEYLSQDGYLDDEFADYLDVIREQEDKDLTINDIHELLEAKVIAATFAHEKGEYKYITEWYRKQFEKGGILEDCEMSLKLA